jgi:hypothetical protein
MLFERNQFQTNPIKGNAYKLWSLPVGTKAKREGLQIGGKTVQYFEIVEHSPNAIYAKSDWDYIFHLDASLEAVVV